MNLKFNKNKKLAEIIRVNQAGEFGAKKIYEGQLSVINDMKNKKIIKKMAAQEENHLKTFNKIMLEEGIRPTIFSPIWDLGGFLLGAVCASIGKETAMACTVAVEEVINEHYESQKKFLGKSKKEKELLKIIEKFRLEELEHKEIALKNDAKKAQNYKGLTKRIKNITSIAIFLSKKI